MEFSTETVKKAAEILIAEMERLGLESQEMRTIETTLRQLLRAVGNQTLQGYLEQADERLDGAAAESCPCQGKRQYHSRRQAVLLSVFGRVNYRRRYFVCPACHQGCAPLDQGMGLAPGQVTAGLAELLALAGVEMAFEEATRWLERFLLFRVSDNTVRGETERFGQLQAAQEKHWKEQSQQEAWLQARQQQPGPQPGRLYGSLDGVMAPLKKEWRELKVIAWYQVEPVRSDPKRRPPASQVGDQKGWQAQAISYHCDLQGADQFGELVWASGCMRQADLHQEVVFVCDGAAWIWKLVEQHFPQAVQIVDWYHASAYLPPVAEAVFGRGTPEYEAWLEQARQQLWEGQIEELIHDCQLLARGPAAKEAAQRAVTYFTHNQKRMDYARFREQGYFIGSGTVESACKQISTLRLKRGGARWTERGAVQTAKARAAWLSSSWDALAEARAALPLAT